MKTSIKNLNKNENAVSNDSVTAVAEVETLEAIAPVAATALAAPGQWAADVQGELDSSDFKLPVLMVTQKIGPMSEKFTPGDITLNKELVLVNADTTKPEKKAAGVEITVIKIRSYYEEVVPYGGDEFGRTFNTEAEVEAAGLTARWIDNVPATAKSVAEAMVCIKDPTGADDMNFPYEFDGARYAFAMWTIRGTAYKASAQEIFTARKFYYREGLKNGSFWLTCPWTKFPSGNGSFVATLRKHKKHTPAFVAWLTEFSI
jgi:hypothetical protein